MFSEKKRVYIALYPSGVVENEERRWLESSASLLLRTWRTLTILQVPLGISHRAQSRKEIRGSWPPSPREEPIRRRLGVRGGRTAKCAKHRQPTRTYPDRQGSGREATPSDHPHYTSHSERPQLALPDVGCSSSLQAGRGRRGCWYRGARLA
ncbi:hypothetical protein SODALDRAFT_10179 [Sodiomyces alkalinus F11]|uniref:Uncharacterized protein n=1 Tax=Sodiomyces alkalinus (strain CBS 110278 / VKM F-3762 / F11) TaxID=1314773 RepID=A0A3N2Q6B6_SODAK|nr:hypothetical protein SODALDRAFT_10179 [Sodiomyces alkalinus F11]ROT42208.1 hypothetical protein SODALDRAFT_10179 [Sodiomyces alkalinus F11]